MEKYQYDGEHVSNLGLAKASDKEILEKAREENAVIITADLDFPRLLALSADKGPGLILFRGGNYSDKEMSDLLTRVLEKIEFNILSRSVCVVDKNKIRVTHLPLSRK
ncbi:MAG: DUF5615 family PIN-like protein [Calditrichaceae bacterium]|nr:DUF5615 family PIN-like protein [Calditrichaceae bacterium]HES59833.1 hypothetical protein [Caldithrix sp.]